MTTVTVYTAERMAEIEAQAVVGASIVDGHVIFERFNGTTFDGGTIDVSVIGNISLGLDNEEYYRYTDAASPFALTTNIRTPMDDTIMDTDDGNPAWGHWDTDDNNRFIFDVAGLYSVYSYATVDSSGTGAGYSELWISDSASSGMSYFKHESTFDSRVEAQLTMLYEVGQSVRIDVRTQGSLSVDYAELFIKKFNIDMVGGVEEGSPAGFRDISFVIDGGESEISVGAKNAFVRCPYDCVITGWTLLGDQTGSVVIDVWKDSYGNFPPTDADSITAAALPTITTDIKDTSTDLTGWNTDLSAGDILEINVDSVTDFTKLILTLQVTV